MYSVLEKIYSVTNLATTKDHERKIGKIRRVIFSCNEMLNLFHINYFNAVQVT